MITLGTGNKFTRVKYIQGFEDLYEDVDTSKIVEIEQMGVTENEIVVEIKKFANEEHPNTAALEGYWRIANEDVCHIYDSTADVAQKDEIWDNYWEWHLKEYRKYCSVYEDEDSCPAQKAMNRKLYESEAAYDIEYIYLYTKTGWKVYKSNGFRSYNIMND